LSCHPSSLPLWFISFGFVLVIYRYFGWANKLKGKILCLISHYGLSYCTVWLSRSAEQIKDKRSQAAHYRRISYWTLRWLVHRSLSSKHTKSTTRRPYKLNTPSAFIFNCTLSTPSWRPSPIRTPVRPNDPRSVGQTKTWTNQLAINWDKTSQYSKLKSNWAMIKEP